MKEQSGVGNALYKRLEMMKRHLLDLEMAVNMKRTLSGIELDRISRVLELAIERSFMLTMDWLLRALSRLNASGDEELEVKLRPVLGDETAKTTARLVAMRIQLGDSHFNSADLIDFLSKNDLAVFAEIEKRILANG